MGQTSKLNRARKIIDAFAGVEPSSVRTGNYRCVAWAST